MQKRSALIYADDARLVTMKILVLSDSHSAMRFMRQCVDAVKPQAIIHLGDYYDDAQTLAELYPQIELHHVPGNCDRYRCPPWVHPTLGYAVGGVRLYMTHGHKQGVKSSTAMMEAEARVMHAKAALYGHTHVAECRWCEDGMLVMNPGSAGYGGGSAGLIETQDGEILSARILLPENLEEFV